MNKFPKIKKGLNLLKNKKNDNTIKSLSSEIMVNKVKFEIYGEEMIDKVVKSSGNSGRVYLPPDWVGRHVKVVRVD